MIRNSRCGCCRHTSRSARKSSSGSRRPCEKSFPTGCPRCDDPGVSANRIDPGAKERRLLIAVRLSALMESESTPAIDVHGHYGEYIRVEDGSLRDRLPSADAAEVARRALQANIVVTIVSPLQALLPRFGADAVSGNRQAAADVAGTPGLRQYVVIDPRVEETYRQAAEMLAQPQCVGIKIHPEEHGYPVVEFGDAIFRFAADQKAVVLTHTSEANSRAHEFVRWADEFPEVRIILAHIGHGLDGDLAEQVRAVERSRHGNLYADTSSARSITPGLIEWAVSEIGAEHVLFGTDTPLYHTAMQRARIDHADLSDREKTMILRENAVRLFGFEEDPATLPAAATPA
ncbi:MAG: amidohydrolase [Planctomycetota bacterium]|nr:MAG: amidohydrolase [Planctomycetota bacterium]REK37662.1 MAG: amidohydrolase [Planctomycetota bacterium]